MESESDFMCRYDNECAKYDNKFVNAKYFIMFGCSYYSSTYTSVSSNLCL